MSNPYAKYSDQALLGTRAMYEGILRVSHNPAQRERAKRNSALATELIRERGIQNQIRGA